MMASRPRPQVTPLAEGTVFETKWMEATEGVQWPRHKASEESVLDSEDADVEDEEGEADDE